MPRLMRLLLPAGIAVLPLVLTAQTSKPPDTRLVLRTGNTVSGVMIGYADGVYTIETDGHTQAFQAREIERLEPIQTADIAPAAPKVWTASITMQPPHKTTAWTLPSSDTTAVLQVSCKEKIKGGGATLEGIMLSTDRSLLRMTDSDGEIEVGYSFGGGLLTNKDGRILQGYQSVLVSKSKNDLADLVTHDGQAFMVRVSGHGHEELFTFLLAGARSESLGGACRQR